MARSGLHFNPIASVGALIKAATAGLFCAILVMPGDLVAATARHKATKHAETVPQIAPEQRTLHALDRLTFGPRPGEVAAVDKSGLEAWFQRQLHPEQIPDAALASRLAHYPAMQLSQVQLVERYPTPEMLRRYTRGGLAVPDDDVERAIYADASLSYEEKVAARKATQAEVGIAAAMSAPASTGATSEPSGASGTGAPSSPAVSEQGMAAPIVRRRPESPQHGSSQPPMIVSGVDAEPAAMVAPAKDAILALPPSARWQRLVSMSPEEMQSLQSALKGPEQERLYAGMSPVQMEQAAAMKSPERLIGAETLSVRLLRDVYSERQLQAVMTDFWLNHFSVYLRKNQNEPYLLPAYERDAVLPNSLGRFEDLLVATAKSPAMLVYLDNWESIGPNSRAAGRAQPLQGNRSGVPVVRLPAKTPKGINENYARELMELHTLGVKGGYTQQDVIEVAKCFSGWTIDRPAEGGEFLFNPNRHEPGDKTVMGHVIHEGGMNEGLEVLHLLATSPATAHFVSLKLAQRFVSDAPPPALVDRMSASFLKTDGDIKAVLATMFHSPEFWSPGVYRAKVKTPMDFVASALRATNAEVTNPLPVVQALDRLGMPIYGMQTPNGYSSQADAWVSSNALLTRMNFALVLAGNRLGGTHIDWNVLPGTLGNDGALPDETTERRLEQVLLGEPATEKTREAALSAAGTPGVQQQAEQTFRATPASSAKPVRDVDGLGGMVRVKAGRAPAQGAPGTPLATVAGLLLGSPDFQRR